MNGRSITGDALGRLDRGMDSPTRRWRTGSLLTSQSANGHLVTDSGLLL